MDRFGWLTVPREPLARTLVQGKYLVWLLLHRARLKDVREELVIPIPPTLIVERNDEQVGALEGLQHRLPGFPPGNRIAQGAAQAVKDGGLQ